MAKKKVKTWRDVLNYSKKGCHQSTVRKYYLLWRKEQNPPLPLRCDNPDCTYHTAPLVWNGKPIKLILDHMDGNRADNRPKKLRLLCPNCDAQLSDTRGGANKGRMELSEGGFARRRRDGKRDYTIVIEPASMEVFTPKERAKIKQKLLEQQAKKAKG